MAQVGPKLASIWPQVGPKLAQVAPKLAPNWPKFDSRDLPRGPPDPQEPPKMVFGANLALLWGQIDPT